MSLKIRTFKKQKIYRSIFISQEQFVIGMKKQTII